MAISTGNPLVKEQIEISDRLTKLSTLKSAHEDKVRNAKMQLEKNKKDLTRYTDTVVPAAEADAKAARDLSGDNFVGRVNGKTVTKRKEFGALVIDANKKAFSSKDKLVKIGSISGFDMYASNSTFTITIMGQARHEVGINPDSPEGTATRIVNLIDGFKKNAEEAKAKLQQLKDSIPALEEVANQKFDHEEEYEATVARAKEIEEELKKIQELDADVSDDAYEIDSETGEILEDTREVLAMKAGNGTKNTEDSLEISHIKDQIRAHSDELNAMKSVVTVPIKRYPRGTFRTDIAKDIAVFFRKYGFKIKVKGLGEVTIDEKRIKNSLKYTAGNLAETSAYIALPEVLKKGIQIESHINHKGRLYETVTIAAPVKFVDAQAQKTITGNVGVVVRKEEKNYYKVHRVLAPDGTVLEFEKEASATYVGRSQNDSSLSTITNASVTDNVTQPKKNGNKNQIGDGDNTEAWEATKASDNDVEKPKTLSEIIAGIQHDFGINITNGNIRGSRILGEYNTRDKGIKTKITNNLPTVAHELGHWFDKKYSITSSRDIPRAVREELRTALGELASEYSQAERLGEGFAEFMRLYLQNRETAAIDYPEATKYLLSKLEAKDLSQLTALTDEVNAYYAMGADTAQSAIVDHENRLIDKRTRLEKFYDEKDHLYQKYVDSLHGIRRMGQSVDSDKSYIYASNAAYSDARAVETLTSDLRDIDGAYVGKGLKTSLEGINIDPKDQKYRDFSEYLVCAHGIEFLEQGKRVFADDRMNSTQYMENRLNELENKYSDFRHISENLYEFLDNFTQTYAVDTGLISQNAYDEMKEMYPRYVPFFRAGYKSRGNSLFRAKGSGREIINPIDNIITMVVKTTNAATRNNVLLKIREEALNLGINALFIEKIPAPLRPKRFDATGLKQELTENVMDAYVDTQGDPEFANSVFGIIDRIDDVLVQFDIGRAKDNVVQIFVGGNKEFWKVNDELLLESITNMNARTSNALLNAYGKFTRFMTSNITGQNVIWSIFSNAPRDLQTAYVYSGNKNPLPLLKDIGTAYVNSFRHAMGNSVDPLYTEYLAMGGGGAGVWVGDETFVKDVRKQLNANYKRLNANIFKDIQFLSETIEMGPRFAIYASLRRNGRTPQQAFYEAMELTVNFRRHGTVSKDINKAVQFFNASMQGADKSVRWFTAEDKKGSSTRKNAVMQRTAWFVAISAAMAAIQYALNNTDDEDEKNYQLLSNYTKNAYYTIPLGSGKYFAIPKARELSVLTSLIERGFEFAVGKNKHAFDEFYSYWAENCLPNIASEVAQFPFRAADEGVQSAVDETVAGVVGSIGIVGILANMYANRDFLGRPIVTNTYKEKLPKDQYNSSTSAMAYWLGQALNLSPQKIDYFGENFLGYMWENAAAVLPIDDGNGVKGTADYTLGVQNKYLKDNAYSQDITNWLYDEKDKDSALAEHDETDMKAAIDYKLDGVYASFYQNFNKLNRNNLTSSQREARQGVLDILKGYRDAKESGIYPGSMTAVMSVVQKSGDSSILPAVMKVTVKDAEKTEFNLSDVQYVEYQTLYNKYYYENVESQLNLKASINEQVSIVKQCKAAALNKATNDMLKRFSNAVIDRSKDDAGANIAKNDYTAALTEAREKDENGQLSASEKYDLALEYFKKAKSTDKSAEDFYYDTLSNDQKASYDIWGQNGGTFDNYDEYLDVSDITANKDANGKSISYSKKNKVASFITDQNWNSKLEELAWEKAGYEKDTYSEYIKSGNYSYMK